MKRGKVHAWFKDNILAVNLAEMDHFVPRNKVLNIYVSYMFSSNMFGLNL